MLFCRDLGLQKCFFEEDFATVVITIILNNEFACSFSCLTTKFMVSLFLPIGLFKVLREKPMVCLRLAEAALNIFKDQIGLWEVLRDF